MRSKTRRGEEREINQRRSGVCKKGERAIASKSKNGSLDFGEKTKLWGKKNKRKRKTA